MRSPIIVMATLLIAGNAQGAVIYSQTPVVTGLTWSDLDTGNIKAQQISLASSDTVKSVIWRGRGGVVSHAQDFTISFFNDAFGNVGSLLGAVHIGTPLSSTDTGQDISSESVFEFVADLGAGVALPSGNLWISIYNNTIPDVVDDDWSWADGNPTNFATTYSVNGGTTWSSSSPSQFYFVLNNASVVPVPAAIWLFGGALGSLGWLKRRQAKA